MRDVLLRTKSQAYLFGSLRRRFPDESQEALRTVLVQLKHDPSLSDEDFTTAPRKPTKGREAGAEPCWQPRAAQLAAVVEHHSPAELIAIAHQQLGWSRNFTIQTLAAAETAGLVTYEALCWARSNSVSKKIKVDRIERVLPCLLSPEQSRRAAQDAAGKLVERAELERQIAELRAKVRECQKEFLRLVVASAQATENRPVACEQRIDYKLGSVEVTRLDTNELIEARELKPDEKQLPLGAVV